MSRARVTAAVEPHGARARSRTATVRGAMRLPSARHGDVLGASRPHKGRAACGEELAEAAGRRGSSAIRRDTVALLLRSGSSRSGARRLAARVSLLRVGRELPAVQRLRRRLLLLRRVPKVALENSSTDLPRPFGRRARSTSCPPVTLRTGEISMCLWKYVHFGIVTCFWKYGRSEIVLVAVAKIGCEI